MRHLKVKFQSTQFYLRGNRQMAEIKINQLNTESTEMIDIKKESAQGNSEAFVAFITLRGGGSCCWCPQPEPLAPEPMYA
ncbi:MAG: hypothetical protein RMY29_018935 [Nostoc sp. CreGUA01]|nr:hypothetical protein [Nostoc sp. CreGUA01]